MLTMEPVVHVELNMGNIATTSYTFSVGAIIGPSTVLKTETVRFRTYNSLEAVGADFAVTDPEYVAASKYFGVTPTPKSLSICYFDHGASTPETPLDGLKAAIEEGMDFYGLFICPKASETEANIKAQTIAVVEYLASTRKHGVVFYGVTGTAASAIASGSLMHTFASYSDRRVSMRAFGMLCDSTVDDAAGALGLAMGYASTYEYNSFALAYKDIASAAVKDLTQAEIESVKEVNGNVFVKRTKTLKCLENGSTGAGLRFDDILYLDRIIQDVQSTCFDVLASSVNKLPQNDSTSDLFVSSINRELENYYNGGVLTDGVWRGEPIGSIETGDVIEHGYAIYVDSFNNQPASDRVARKAMPITILLQFAGAVESITLNLYVQE